MDPEIIKAVVDVGKAAGTAAGLSVPFTGIVKRMLGPAADEVAEMWRDQIRLYRYGRQLKLLEKAEKMAQDAGFTPQAVPLKILFPLLEGASFEDNEDLHTMWAALLANAASPKGDELVKPDFISVLKIMSPDGAKLLDWMVSFQQGKGHASAAHLRDVAAAYNTLGFGSFDVAIVLGPRPIPNHLLNQPIINFGMCLNFLTANALSRCVSQGTQETKTDHAYFVTWRGQTFVQACRPPKPKS